MAMTLSPGWMQYLNVSTIFLHFLTLYLVEREIKKIESKPHISPALSEQLKGYISLLKLQSQSTIYGQVIVTSSVTLQGFGVRSFQNGV